jgi:hypothetical protein
MLWFCKPDPRRRTHHLHLVLVQSARYRDELRFRDYLRAHPDAAGRYALLKKELAAEYQRDRDAYTQAKTQFVRTVLGKADLPCRGEIRSEHGSDPVSAQDLLESVQYVHENPRAAPIPPGTPAYSASPPSLISFPLVTLPRSGRLVPEVLSVQCLDGGVRQHSEDGHDWQSE